MERRLLKPLDAHVSAIGLGTWPLAGVCELAGSPVGRGAVDVSEARRALHTALDTGINFFDTAPTYGNAESLLGDVLASSPNDAIVCTKFGIRVTDDGRAIKDFSGQSLIDSVESSLYALKRDRIDIMLLHSPHDEFDWLDYDVGPLERLRRQGKIGCYGVSCHSVFGAARALEYGFGQVIEVIYNALDRRAEEEVLETAAQQQTGVIVRVPLAQGFLAGRYLDAPPLFDDTDHRSTFSDQEIHWLWESARQLQFLGELPGGMATSALRFCLTHPAVTTVIPGMRSCNQVVANSMAGELEPLDEMTLEKIRQAIPKVYQGWSRTGLVNVS